MENDDRLKKSPAVYSKTIRAGRRRTYFFDVRTTKSNDYYITLTESKKKFNEDGYERHKIFLYKEDFNKFVEALNNTINHVKTDLLPEYDFDEFNNREYDGDEEDDFGDDEERHNAPKKTYEPHRREHHAPPVAEVKLTEAEPTTPVSKPTEEFKAPKADDFSEEDLKW